MDMPGVDKLSEMQRACLRLVAELKKTEQIAGELGISPSTVNTHIERAIARLAVPNRREAARLVVAWDMVRAGRDAATADAGRPEKYPTEKYPLPAAPLPMAWPASSTVAIGKRRNDLTVSQRLLLALVALALLCLGIAGLGAAIEQLSHWRSSLAQRR